MDSHILIFTIWLIKSRKSYGVNTVALHDINPEIVDSKIREFACPPTTKMTECLLGKIYHNDRDERVLKTVTIIKVQIAPPS